MKIAKIEQFSPYQRMRLVKITTDNGIVGWGETILKLHQGRRIASIYSSILLT